MKCVISDPTKYEEFCRNLAGMEVIYAEFSDDYIDKKHRSAWLIYAMDGNKLKRQELYFSDTIVNVDYGGLWEVLGRMAREGQLFSVGSRIYMSTRCWLKPNLEVETYEVVTPRSGKSILVRPFNKRSYWQAVYTIYYSSFLFYDSSSLLRELCALVFEYYYAIGQSPYDWEKAIMIQRRHDGLVFNTDYYQASEHNLGTYLARAAYAKIGEQKLKKMIIKNLPILQEMYYFRASGNLFVTENIRDEAKGATTSLLLAIESEMGEDLTKKYRHFKVARVTEDINIDELYAFFQEPRVVDFSDKNDKKIRMAILANRLISTTVEYYLRDRLFLADRKPLTDLWEVVCHILRTTDDDSLFYVAGSVLNELWIYLPEKSKKELDFYAVIYNLYWPRIKSLRLIKQAVKNDVEANESGSNNIFVDAMTWIFCLPYEKLEELNPKLADYTKMLASKEDKKIQKLPSWIMTYVLGLKYQEMPLRTQIKKTLENYPPEQAASNLGWCETAEEAESVLDLLLNDSKKPYQIEAKEACLEKMLIRRNDLEVRRCVLQRLTKDYDLFVKKFNCGSTLINEELVSNRIFFLTAACEGATDERELELLQDFARKFNNDAEANIRRITKQALKLAEGNVKTFSMQRGATTEKTFLEKVKCSAEISVVNYDLERFLSAQKETHDLAVKELSSGRKYGHYMWYTFPQLKGLGRSDKAEYYGLEDEEEAKAYMKNEVLRNNLLEVCEVVLELDTDKIEEVFPYPDNLKLRSCATLFAETFPKKRVFKRILDKYYGGERDEETMRLIDPYYDRKIEIAARKSCPCNQNIIEIEPTHLMKELSKHAGHLGCIYAEAYKLAGWFSVNEEYAKQAKEMALEFIKHKEEFINEGIYNETVFDKVLRKFPLLDEAYWQWTK